MVYGVNIEKGGLSSAFMLVGVFRDKRPREWRL